MVASTARAQTSTSPICVRLLEHKDSSHAKHTDVRSVAWVREPRYLGFAAYQSTVSGIATFRGVACWSNVFSKEDESTMNGSSNS